MKIWRLFSRKWVVMSPDGVVKISPVFYSLSDCVQYKEYRELHGVIVSFVILLKWKKVIKMPKGYQYNRRDENEPLIIEVLNRSGYVGFEAVVKDKSAIGARGFYMNMSKDAGCDLFVWDERGFFAVEVKNPEQPPSKRKLTPRELIFKHLCDAFSVPHYVVETPEYMAEILNGR